MKNLPCNRSAIDLLNQTTFSHGQKTALIFEHTRLTFEQLNVCSNQLANYLRQKGNFSDRPLCFCLPQSFKKVISMLAIWKAGGAYVSLDPLYPETRLLHILDDTDSPILITVKAFAPKFHFYKGEVILIDTYHEEIERMPEEYHPVPGVENGLAYLAYTSGSTGIPKAVMAEHRGLRNFVEHFGRFLDPENEDTVLHISSSNFDGIVLDLWVPLSLGLTVYLYPDNRIVGAPLLDYIRHNAITLLPYLPVSILATLPTDSPIGNLQKIYTGGEAPIPKVIAYWKEQVELINIYGPTETTVVVSGFKFNESHPISTIGKPLPNVDFYVMDDEMKVLPVNETGELYIGGVQVSRGYYNRPDLTAQKFLSYTTPEGKKTRLYKTGDLVRRLGDGTIEFSGRADQQVKIRGFRVEPAEVEENIRQSGLAENCVVILKQQHNDKQLVCFYQKHKDRNIYTEDIRNYLSERMPSYMIPAKFIETEALPLTANGKIDKSALEDYEITGEKRRSFVLPQTELQQQLATQWCSVLHVKSIGIYDNFFQFGGNSILAYKLVSSVHRELNIPLQIADLFLYPTIRELESCILNKEQSDESGPLLSKDPKGPVALSAQQQGLWFLDRLHGSVAYNIGTLYPLNEDVSLPLLEKAFRALLKTHPILRTIVQEKDPAVYQETIHENNWLLQTLHQSGNIRELINIPFDLQRDYMLRAYVIHEAAKPVSLLLVVHHMVTDGWSMPLIINEINNLYHRMVCNKACEAANPAPAYTDYIHWQSNQNQKDGIAFWKNYLEDIPVLQIAQDFQKQQLHTNTGKQYPFEIDEQLTEALKKISENHSATLYMTLLSAFGLLMQYYSGQQDICIGSPSANRPHPFDKTIGYFANMLPIRMKIDGNPVFSNFLKDIRDMISKVFKHQEIPLETIVNHVVKDRLAGHNPLFQHVFVLQSPVEISKDRDPIDGSKVQWIYNGHTKFDLQFEILPMDKKLRVNVDYSDVLFEEKTIIGMVEAYRHILKSIAFNPYQKIGEIAVHTVLEKVQTDLPEPIETLETFIGLFEAQVKRTPSKIALVLSGMGISYRDLDRRSSHVADRLISSGVKKGDFVGCYQEQSIERIITLLAIIKAGAAYVPIDTSYPEERIKTLVADTNPRMLITTANFKVIFNEVDPPVLFIEDLLSTPSGNIRESYSDTHSLTDLAYVIHTSGTTGVPKGSQKPINKPLLTRGLFVFILKYFRHISDNLLNRMKFV